MRVKIILTIAVGAVLAVSGCGGGGKQAGVPPRDRVAAAFYPLAYAAEELAPPGTEVDNLTPPGAEPHDLELTAGDIETIHSADLVLLLGHGFQPQLEAAAGNGEHVLRLLDTPGLDRHPNNDPHVWLDPVRYELIVKQIGVALHRSRSADRLVARLRTLDRDYRRGLRSCARHDIVTSHEAFAYLGERYGLRQVAITGLSPEAEPTPKRLEQVVRLVGTTGATTIFFETLVSPRIADTVARETGARTAVLDPIEGLTPAERKRGASYFSVMRSNLANLRRALGCR
jgi:zinc transport system substrate-binding protein